MRLLFAAAVITASLAGPVAAGEITFQGLTGTTTPLVVESKFRNALHVNGCHGSQTKIVSSDGDWDCDELVVDDYDVGGTHFKATFLFRPDTHVLGQVFITHAFEYLSAENDQRLTKDQLIKLYSIWRDLLAFRYGEERGNEDIPGFPPCVTQDQSWGFTLCAKWQGRPSKKWDDSDGTVELTVDGSKRPDELTYFGWLSITYNLVDETAAGRL